MPVGVATDLSEAWRQKEGIDGILGLELPDINTGNATRDTFMERLIDSVAPPTVPVFTVDLEPERIGGVPTIEIGRIDPEKINGSLYYAPIKNMDGYWDVEDVTFDIEGLNYTQTMNIGMFYHARRVSNVGDADQL
ncbi:MAG: hypothetical protein Q9207_003507 [Kuettlingeria erythrocarpa]